MNLADLDRIEAELSIRLPDAYRDTMLEFPIAACVGNSDTDLWDDAAALIRFNLELRRGAPGGVPPWPPHLFALGHGGDGSPYALDLRDPSLPVWWVDHGAVASPGSGPVGSGFADWFRRYVDDVVHDLEADGIDPRGTPKERDLAEARNARQSCVAFLAFLAVVGAVLLAVVTLANR
jgi:hypothetical protein